ncbi:MAG: hypothetical protein WCS87_14265 [Methylococcaceae bacterium]
MPRCWQGNRKELPLQHTDIVTENRIKIDRSQIGKPEVLATHEQD